MGAPAMRLEADPKPVAEVRRQLEKKQVIELRENDLSQPTWLWLCECGKYGGELHGYFRFTGKRSDPFFTKKEGMRILDKALDKGLVSLEIAVAFEQGIDGCPLLDGDD